MARNGIRLILLCCTAALMCFSARGVGRQLTDRNRPLAGRVIDCRGDWERHGDPREPLKLKLGSEVYAGDRIVARPGQSYLYISIALLNGQAMGCDSGTARPCDQNLIIPITLDPPQSDWRARLAQAVHQVMQVHVPPMVFAMVRGESGPSEAVLRFSNSRLDLGPALLNVTEGHYLAELTKLENPDEASSRIRFEFEWNPPSSQSVVAIKPGVYRLRLLSSDGDKNIGAPVAVLITDSNEYEESDRKFQEAKKATDAWRDVMRPATLHYVWTVYLYRLAEESNGTHQP